MELKHIRDGLLKQTKQKIKEHFAHPDIHIVRAVTTLDELDGLFNQLYEQVVEWYAVHFPELSRTLSDPETFLECVVLLGNRKNFSSARLKKMVNAHKAVELEKKAKSSIGSCISPSALSHIQSTANTARTLRKQRFLLEQFVEAETKKMMPRACALVAPLLAGRLVKEAGSLKKLAVLPASTIQILGAEKALFRHKKYWAKPPKHGIIFQHPSVQKALPRERGKAARKLAGQLSIAIRQDYFSE